MQLCVQVTVALATIRFPCLLLLCLAPRQTLRSISRFIPPFLPSYGFKHLLTSGIQGLTALGSTKNYPPLPLWSSLLVEVTVCSIHNWTASDQVTKHHYMSYTVVPSTRMWLQHTTQRRCICELGS